MAEDWLDCPVLGPGWKRRETLRKSGATCGRSDTYYQSPTGERIRSKVELTRFLGPDCDLSCFDFKHGVLQSLPARASSQKKRRTWPKKSKLSLKEPEPQGSPLAPTSKDLEASNSSSASKGPLSEWCSNCGASFSKDSSGRQRLRSLCKGCRAQRNAFNREQRMFKRVGCGDCKACRVTEDCGICSACVVNLPQSATSRLPRSQCVQRHCVKIIKKQMKKRPRGLPAKKLPGRHPRGPAPPLPDRANSSSGTAKDRPPSKLPRSQSQQLTRLPTVVTRNIGHKPGELDMVLQWGQSSPAPSQLRYLSPRQSRQCGVCAACLLRVDCGQCDFCQDKPKFGGCNQKRQKCRWRQCLKFAMKRLLPTARWDSRAVQGAALPLHRPRRRKGALVNRACQPGRAKSGGLQGQRLATEALSSGLEGANRAQLHHSLKQGLGKGEKEAKAPPEASKANTPVIMEIYSLSGATPTAAGPCEGLDSVLQEFLGELNELPLPAHWEVLPPRGPDLCIIQRSSLSTMAAAVIHIQPGLYFHVVVQDVPVPPTHELYSAHPLRLTTVDEVVELICNLEAYHLCPGWPASWCQGPRSPDCDVLVYKGRCQSCCRKP